MAGTAPIYPRAQGSESCGSPGSAFPPLHWHQRCHGAADPSQNQLGAEAAGLNPVQFLNLFVTWATTSCWRVREGSEYTGPPQQLQHFWMFTQLQPHTGVQCLSSQPRAMTGLAGFPAPNRLEKSVNHGSWPLLYLCPHCKHHREGTPPLSLHAV